MILIAKRIDLIGKRIEKAVSVLTKKLFQCQEKLAYFFLFFIFESSEKLCVFAKISAAVALLLLAKASV